MTTELYAFSLLPTIVSVVCVSIGGLFAAILSILKSYGDRRGILYLTVSRGVANMADSSDHNNFSCYYAIRCRLEILVATARLTSNCQKRGRLCLSAPRMASR